MAAIFEKLHMSIPIHKCIDRLNPLRIDRDTIFFKDICNSRGEYAPPQNPAEGIHLPPFQIEMSGTKEHTVNLHIG